MFYVSTGHLPTRRGKEDKGAKSTDGTTETAGNTADTRTQIRQGQIKFMSQELTDEEDVFFLIILNFHSFFGFCELSTELPRL